MARRVSGAGERTIRSSGDASHDNGRAASALGESLFLRHRSFGRDVRTLRLALASTPRLAGDCKGEAMIPPSVDPGHAALVFARAQAAPAAARVDAA